MELCHHPAISNPDSFISSQQPATCSWNTRLRLLLPLLLISVYQRAVVSAANLPTLVTGESSIRESTLVPSGDDSPPPLLEVNATSAVGYQGNSIIGEPIISCAQDAIYAKWRTALTFTGHVSVRYAPNRFCYQVLVTNSQIELLIPHLECRVTRLRVFDASKSGTGVLYESQVLISFHDEFVTRGDRLYTIQCLHTKKDGVNNITTSVPISDPTKDAPRLECSYEVFRKTPSGATSNHFPDERLPVGTPLLHRWSCRHQRAEHCLIVSNCALHTDDSEHELVDEYGCSTVPALVGELDYEGPVNISKEIPLFSVSDKPFVYFQCQLNLVEIAGGMSQCPRPKCSSSGSTKNRPPHHRTPMRKRRDHGEAVKPFLSKLVFDVVSQQVEVLPLGYYSGSFLRPHHHSSDASTLPKHSGSVLDALSGEAEDVDNKGEESMIGVNSVSVVCISHELLYMVALLSSLVLVGLLSAATITHLSRRRHQKRSILNRDAGACSEFREKQSLRHHNVSSSL